MLLLLKMVKSYVHITDLLFVSFKCAIWIFSGRLTTQNRFSCTERKWVGRTTETMEGNQKSNDFLSQTSYRKRATVNAWTSYWQTLILFTGLPFTSSTWRKTGRKQHFPHLCSDQKTLCSLQGIVPSSQTRSALGCVYY